MDRIAFGVGVLRAAAAAGAGRVLEEDACPTMMMGGGFVVSVLDEMLGSAADLFT